MIIALQPPQSWQKYDFLKSIFQGSQKVTLPTLVTLLFYASAKVINIKLNIKLTLNEVLRQPSFDPARCTSAQRKLLSYHFPIVYEKYLVSIPLASAPSQWVQSPLKVAFIFLVCTLIFVIFFSNLVKSIPNNIFSL